MRGDHALFFGLWLQKPLQIAAITPSSEPLGIAGARVAYVWRNLPPAQVWASSARAGHAGEIE
jgi:phospholipid N-methyltransferase